MQTVKLRDEPALPYHGTRVIKWPTGRELLHEQHDREAHLRANEGRFRHVTLRTKAFAGVHVGVYEIPLSFFFKLYQQVNSSTECRHPAPTRHFSGVRAGSSRPGGCSPAGDQRSKRRYRGGARRRAFGRAAGEAIAGGAGGPRRRGASSTEKGTTLHSRSVASKVVRCTA